MNKQDSLFNDKDYKYTPHGTDVLLTPRIDTKTKSGLILPDGVETLDPICDVIAVGEEVKYYKAGDTVILAGKVALKLPAKTKKYIITKEAAIICFAEEIKD